MNTNDHGPLGARSAYPQHYDASLLFPIERAAARRELGLDPAALPFGGVDIWNAYELSWLDGRGKPQVALGQLRVPAHSPRLVESKSLKLYLNSLNQERIGSADAVQELIARDLSAATGAAVTMSLVTADQFAAQRLDELDGECIDALALDIDDYGPVRPAYLCSDGAQVAETLVSHLLKSNCPVTGQPDWASVRIDYAGAAIDRAGLLRYLVSYRDHAGFHEQCVERIWCDLWQRCSPHRLSVYARYTRRGGLDINPWRSNGAERCGNPRGARQ